MAETIPDIMAKKNFLSKRGNFGHTMSDGQPLFSTLH